MNVTELQLTTTASEPYHVQWKIRKEVLLLTWKCNTTTFEQPLQYYIYISSSSYGGQSQPLQYNGVATAAADDGNSNYINVKNGSQSIELKGLKPYSVYKIKVCCNNQSTLYA